MKNVLVVLVSLVSLNAVAQSEREAVCKTLRPYFGQWVEIITYEHVLRALPASATSEEDVRDWTMIRESSAKQRMAEQKEDRKRFAGLPHLDTFLKVRAELMRRYKEFPHPYTGMNTSTANETLNQGRESAVGLAQNLGYSVCMAGV